jgi:uncharacterized protein YdbL (DUF1318 family)
MNYNKMTQLSLLLLLCMLISASTAFAGVKERMKERLPAIADLKSKGIIGENNSGYLGYVTSNRVNEALIAAENKDRKSIYAYFAKQQNTTLEKVELIQAKRKAERAKPGEFIQTPDGKWVKK